MDGMKIKASRRTTESQIEVVADFGGVSAEYRKDINTGIDFLNHMIEHIAWRGEVNIKIDVKLDKFLLTHVICEDLGMTFGRAVAEYVSKSRAYGVMGFGDAVGIIDEAKAQAAFSFEDRSYFDFTSAVEIPSEAEGMASEDLLVFLDGFCQGARCTLHLDVQKGKNAHHIWESAFRAVGSALKNTLALSEARAGRTSGVAGAVEYEVKQV